ncbi:unnamed protein product [Prorocentrum cordatum]|uniref:Uncharacterized protein n=1 Tax=Prorocentrum cordatum TaxID=2364126 RepID=A0ABN9Y173_9DINO|nr:unnamed protein product [Polarella glacialis]
MVCAAAMVIARSCDLSVLKETRARVPDSSDLPSSSAGKKSGKDAADRVARSGLGARPTGPSTVLQQVRRTKNKIAKATCSLVARLLPMCPALDLRGGPGVRRGPEPKTAAPICPPPVGMVQHLLEVRHLYASSSTFKRF